MLFISMERSLISSFVSTFSSNVSDSGSIFVVPASSSERMFAVLRTLPHRKIIGFAIKSARKRVMTIETYRKTAERAKINTFA